MLVVGVAGRQRRLYAQLALCFRLGNAMTARLPVFDASPLPQGAGQPQRRHPGRLAVDAVTDYSENQRRSRDARPLYGRSPEAQKDRAIRASFLPTVAGLYSDPDLLDAQPFMGPLYDVFTSAAARPSTVTGELYNEVSAAYFNAVHSILTGEASSEDALLDLEDELIDITGFEVGQP
jgi:trehalose/maltose transport system substrate-binding protein